MRKKLIAKIGIVGLAAIFLLSMASYSTDQEFTTHGKPDKPGKPKTEGIEFWGDLVGGQVVEGCCPNDGPFPAYTMTLKFNVSDDLPAGTYDGQLFINTYGAGRNQEYIVQFWNDELCLGIEIIGGVIDRDRKNKVTTVTFTDELCANLYTGDPIAVVNFTLVRRPY